MTKVPTCRSVTACTSASAPRWRAWKGASHSRRSCGVGRAGTSTSNAGRWRTPRACAVGAICLSNLITGGIMSNGSAVDVKRVVVWSTGGIGSLSIVAVNERPDLELVGVWVHSDEKVGKDAGELANGVPIGITATNDVDALLALAPDCVIYAASGPERDAGAIADYERILAAGVNVVTTTSTTLINPRAYVPAHRARLEAAAREGGASIYASGIEPGFLLRLRPARTVDRDAVDFEDPLLRDRALRRLRRGGDHDRRAGLRPAARLRAVDHASRRDRRRVRGPAAVHRRWSGRRDR